MKYFNILILLFFLFMTGCKSSILEDPQTSIRYSVLQESHVKLTVENSYNTIIATLVDQPQSAGNYEVEMDMSNLPEGVYFYTLECIGINNGYYSKMTQKLFLGK